MRNSFVGLDAYDKVINSGVDVVLLATPPGFRPQHLTAAVNANKHVFCEKPCATDSPGVREVMAAQKLAQSKNLALVAGFCWRYNNMIQEAVQQVRNGAIGRLVAHHSTYYTNPVKPMPPESARPAGMSDIEWQIRNWYNFNWLVRRQPGRTGRAQRRQDHVDHERPAAAERGGGRRPRRAGQRRQHLRPLRGQLRVSERLPRIPRQPPVDRLLQRHARLRHGHRRDAAARQRASRGSKAPDGQVKWQFQGEEYDMYQREHDVLFASIRAGKPKNDDLNLATSTLLAHHGTPRRLHRPAGHLGAGAELERQPGAEAGRLERASTRCPGSRSPAVPR